jgi:hypothetical protein
LIVEFRRPQYFIKSRFTVGCDLPHRYMKIDIAGDPKYIGDRPLNP